MLRRRITTSDAAPYRRGTLPATSGTKTPRTAVLATTQETTTHLAVSTSPACASERREGRVASLTHGKGNYGARRKLWSRSVTTALEYRDLAQEPFCSIVCGTASHQPPQRTKLVRIDGAGQWDPDPAGIYGAKLGQTFRTGAPEGPTRPVRSALSRENEPCRCVKPPHTREVAGSNPAGTTTVLG